MIKISLQYHEHTKTYRVATYCFLDKINIIRTKKRKQKIGIKILSLFCSLIMKNQVTSDKPLNEFCNSGSVMPLLAVPYKKQYPFNVLLKNCITNLTCRPS